MDAVVLFFLLGVAARLARSDLRVPEAIYEALSIYLLLAIGLKGGVELARHPLAGVLLPALAVLAMGVALPLLAFPLLRLKLNRFDAASIAAHYGSVSAVTFAVAITWLTDRAIAYDPQVTFFVVLLEIPAIAVGILLARMGRAPAAPAGQAVAPRRVRWGEVLREVLLGKSLVLLAGGLLIGWIAGPAGIAPMKLLYTDLFKGLLALFMLEMGLVAGSRVADLRRAGPFIIAFGLLWPLAASCVGAAVGRAIGLSVGGTMLLATLAASASYIAAPAAMRIAIPQASPSLSIGASLGITFPFNVLVGIPLYYQLALWMHG
jgi:hypothetical protein